MEIDFIPIYEYGTFTFCPFGISVDSYSIDIVIFNIEIEIKRKSR